MFEYYLVPSILKSNKSRYQNETMFHKINCTKSVILVIWFRTYIDRFGPD